AAAARGPRALLVGRCGGRPRSPVERARDRVGLRAAAIAVRRGGVAAVPARLRRRPRRAAAGGLPVGALLVSALRPLLLPVRPLLARRLRAIAAIFARVLRALAAILVHVFPVILPGFARVLAGIVVIVPRVVVHVAAAVPAVRAIVIVV